MSLEEKVTTRNYAVSLSVGCFQTDAPAVDLTSFFSFVVAILGILECVGRGAGACRSSGSPYSSQASRTSVLGTARNFCGAYVLCDGKLSLSCVSDFYRQRRSKSREHVCSALITCTTFLALHFDSLGMPMPPLAPFPNCSLTCDTWSREYAHETRLSGSFATRPILSRVHRIETHPVRTVQPSTRKVQLAIAKTAEKAVELPGFEAFMKVSATSRVAVVHAISRMPPIPFEGY